MAKYAILGVGALGGLYGGLLAKSGVETHFLARSDLDHLQKHGLQVESPWGNFHVNNLNVYQSPEEMPPADVVVVAWKATSNPSLPLALEALCHAQSIVLVLQNGLDVEHDAAAVVGEDRVLGGCCFLCCNKIAPGHIKHLDYGRIVFGEFGSQNSGQITHRMQMIASDFRAAGIDIEPSANLLSVRWKKLAWNIPFNGLSVVLAANTQEIMEDPAASALAKSLMEEVREAAAANGVAIEATHIQKMLDDTRRMVPYDSSMLLDFRAGRAMEVEAIFGNPLRAARQAGYNPSKIDMLYQQLSFLGNRSRTL
ncbi:MAG: putative 2-dehydropantoate 2-reductase [Pirellulaceae bacterium]